MNISREEKSKLRKLFSKANQINVCSIPVKCSIDHYLIHEDYHCYGLEDLTIIGKLKIPKNIKNKLEKIYADIHKICVQIAKKNKVSAGEVKEAITYHGKKIEMAK